MPNPVAARRSLCTNGVALGSRQLAVWPCPDKTCTGSPPASRIRPGLSYAFDASPAAEAQAFPAARSSSPCGAASAGQLIGNGLLHHRSYANPPYAVGGRQAQPDACVSGAVFRRVWPRKLPREGSFAAKFASSLPVADLVGFSIGPAFGSSLGIEAIIAMPVAQEHTSVCCLAQRLRHTSSQTALRSVHSASQGG